MALWQTGVQWAPAETMLKTDYNSAIEHVAKNFVEWTEKVARAITEHKKDPNTEEARRRSGNSSFGKHGLTVEEEQLRRERRYHRANYYWALELDRQLQASKGNGKSRAGEHTKGKGKKSKPVTPKPLSEMSRDDWWYLEKLGEGVLLAEMLGAESKCYKVQANDFFVNEC